MLAKADKCFFFYNNTVKKIYIFTVMLIGRSEHPISGLENADFACAANLKSDWLKLNWTELNWLSTLKTGLIHFVMVHGSVCSFCVACLCVSWMCGCLDVCLNVCICAVMWICCFWSILHCLAPLSWFTSVLQGRASSCAIKLFQLPLVSFLILMLVSVSCQAILVELRCGRVRFLKLELPYVLDFVCTHL